MNRQATAPDHVELTAASDTTVLGNVLAGWVVTAAQTLEVTARLQVALVATQR